MTGRIGTLGGIRVRQVPATAAGWCAGCVFQGGGTNPCSTEAQHGAGFEVCAVNGAVYERVPETLMPRVVDADDISRRLGPEAARMIAEADKETEQKLAAGLRTLVRLGYTYEGGEVWKPPLGAPALTTKTVPGAGAPSKLHKPTHGGYPG